jgi:hypothetical protein
VSGASTIKAVGCPGTGAPGGAGSWHLRIAPPRFKAAASGASIASSVKAQVRGRTRRRRVVKAGGATVSYEAGAAGTTRLVVARPARGELRGRTCVAPTRRRRRGQRARTCTRYIPVGSFTHADRPGNVSFVFTGRVRARRLAPGRYVLQLIPAGQRAAVASASFSIVR